MIIKTKPGLNNEFFAANDLLPSEHEQKSGKKILLSQIFNDGNRDYCIVFVRNDDGSYRPNLGYKSLSQGFWRLFPYMECGTFSKGILGENSLSFSPALQYELNNEQMKKSVHKTNCRDIIDLLSDIRYGNHEDNLVKEAGFDDVDSMKQQSLADLQNATLDFTNILSLGADTIKVEESDDHIITRSYYQVASKNAKYTYIFTVCTASESCSEDLKNALKINNVYCGAVYNTAGLNDINQYGLPRSPAPDIDIITRPLFNYPQQIKDHVSIGEHTPYVFDNYNYNPAVLEVPIVNSFWEHMNRHKEISPKITAERQKIMQIMKDNKSHSVTQPDNIDEVKITFGMSKLDQLRARNADKVNGGNVIS